MFEEINIIIISSVISNQVCDVCYSIVVNNVDPQYFPLSSPLLYIAYIFA